MKNISKVIVGLSAIAFFALSSPIFAAKKPAPTPVRTIQFGGYSWKIKSGTAMGPGPNNWSNSPADIFVDGGGALHLTVNNTNGTWNSTEVYLPLSLGYGRYEFDIMTRPQDIDHNLVASPFLYQDDTHELDVEYSYWADEATYNTAYSAQPSNKKDGSYVTYTTKNPTLPITAVIDWNPDRIFYATMSQGVVINSCTYSGKKNFIPGKEAPHINFWQYRGLTPKNGVNSEFVVSEFRFKKS